MPGADDLASITKGQVQNIGELTAWAMANGQTLSTTSSPRSTNLTAVTTTSVLAIATSAVRRAIEFHSSDPANSNMWIMPGTTAFVRRGIYLVPGGRYQINASMAANNCFYAVASSGSTNSLSVVEFF
jgi:hypothetical protein